MAKIKKKKKSIKLKLILAGGIIPLAFLIMVITAVVSSYARYFSDNSISEGLSDEKNNELIEYIKDKVDAINENNTYAENKSRIGKLSDYYGTDRAFKLEWQYILSYFKYDKMSSDNSNVEDYNEAKARIDTVIKELGPEFIYRKYKITTVREYKEKVTSLKETTSNSGSSPTYGEKPENLSGLNPGDTIVVGNEGDSKTYEVVEEEVTKTETKEEEVSCVISIKNIKGSYSLTYREDTSTSKGENETITVTKPVLEGINQTDLPWTNLKSIINKNYKDEDLDKAAEIIVTVGATYVDENVSRDVFFTGGSTFGGSGEVFNGGSNDFIDKVAQVAVAQKDKYSILPSITIAQAILESGWGKSGLTAKANNLFGVKAFGWSGAYIEMATKEYRPDGSEYWITAKFRAYNSWDESIEDHSKVLLQPNFTAVRNASNYKEAAYALSTGGYATDPEYPRLIISMIEQYRLHLYDNMALAQQNK